MIQESGKLSRIEKLKSGVILKQGSLANRGLPIGSGLRFDSGEWQNSRFKVRLYRFMADSIPLVNSVIWTWSRLASAEGKFKFSKDGREMSNRSAEEVLNNLFLRINQFNFGRGGNSNDLMHPFFHSLFLDGAVLGKMYFYPDLSGLSNFEFFDLGRSEISFGRSGKIKVMVEKDAEEHHFSGDDLYYYALNSDLSHPHGKSILRAVPFIAYVEQQLVDDMRRTMHNSGYHRLHVRITPPEKREGENDDAYISRANSYFDSTVSMIKDIDPEDNPVTWEDVTIEHIGPHNSGGSRSNNWYLSHRAMVEELCSGTNLAPFLLGYSYNATTNWAHLKYDLVMRQVSSVQGAAINFFNRLANIELALKGFDLEASWEFNNDFSALAGDRSQVKSRDASSLIELYQAGLIDKETAEARAKRLV